MRAASRLLVVLALAALAPALASAADLPRRKSGLWEMSTAAQQGQTVAATMCVDQKTDDLSRQLAGAGVSCSKQDVRREAANRYVFDSVCKFGESTATSRAVFTGSFDSQYEVDITAKYAPPMMGMNEGRSKIRARWLGPCKAGQRPGDIIMPNGAAINILDSQKPAPKR
jgi:Protein of unknown function (DUF3617)